MDGIASVCHQHDILSRQLLASNDGLAQRAAAEMPGDGWSCKPTLFNWQSMRPHAELHQQPQSGNGHWNLKLWRSLQLAGAQKPSKFKYVQSLALLEGAVLGETCRPSQTF